DYRALGPQWDGAFDTVVANGSLEHFAQPLDAVRGRDDGVYREMFRTVHRLIDPASPSRRFVTTAIHFARRPAPADMARHPAAHPTLVRHPAQAATMFWCMMVGASWNWQFRPPAPTRLLRQTWAYRG